MPEKIREIHPPRGFSRLALRRPLWLYHLDLRTTRKTLGLTAKYWPQVR